MYTLKRLRENNKFFELRRIQKNQGLSFATDLYSLLIKGKYGYVFDFDVYLPTKGENLQRPFVWSLRQQEELIWSLIFERNVPSITFVNHEYKLWQVLDGKQRLTTIKRFMEGMFPIHVEGKEVFWDSLDKELKHLISSPRILYDVYYSYADDPVTDDEKIIIFNQINFSGTPQQEGHIKHLLSL